MKRVISLVIVLLALMGFAKAEHIKGGEMYYEYLGNGSAANSSRYRITLKLYIDCQATNPGQLDEQIPLTVFDRATGNQVGTTLTAPNTSQQFINYDPNSNPCITNPPTGVCYRIRWFAIVTDLPNNSAGYTIAYQRCCRIQNIRNLTPPSGNSGATYFCEIPGTGISSVPLAYQNNSPRFESNDVAAICAGSAFTFSFAAVEIDGDSLVYQLCSGFTGGSTSNPAPPIASRPPYAELNYSPPYSGSAPLGASSTINPSTGLITGIAPGILGQYVITACAYEYRNGTLINIHRKDIHVAVSDCIPLRAQLRPDYAYCDDLLVSFKNEQLNPPGSQYIWSFGDNTKSDTTSDPEGKISHQYSAPGTYIIKLKVILAGGQCIDSTVSVAKVFPGFFPGFSVTGTCVLLPLQFNDTSKTIFGTVSKWRWNFGDASTLADTSRIASPTWKYNTVGFKTVELIVENSIGCIDTVVKQVEVRDKPPIIFPFKDTLICSIDTLQLRASGVGSYSWGPNYNIINANTQTPLVYPKTTTYYTLTLNENGCINTDSVRVRVVDFVTLFAGNDTTICATDTIQLKPSGDGLRFTWSPSTYLFDPAAKNPFANPAASITYRLRATIGKCFADDDINITAVPYPTVSTGPDTTICFQDSATLRGFTNGSRFEWSPTSTLINNNTLTPRAFPLTTTSYTLSAFDVLGCPKPSRATTIVNVRDKVIAFAGNDTNVVIGQQLQLRGSGGDLYLWSPSTYLSNPSSQSPVANLPDNFTYILRAFTQEGCFAYDTINIKVFKTAPDIFVPNAFSPTGKNRVLRPIPVGISEINYFRVFNRWGQLVFETKQAGKGWDGTLAGKLQDNGTYVWMVRGVDFTGKVITKRGTAVLIR